MGILFGGMLNSSIFEGMPEFSFLKSRLVFG